MTLPSYHITFCTKVNSPGAISRSAARYPHCTLPAFESFRNNLACCFKPQLFGPHVLARVSVPILSAPSISAGALRHAHDGRSSADMVQGERGQTALVEPDL
jgi:hypothetical protein